MSATLIAPKDANRSSLLSSWTPGMGSGGTSSKKGETSFNTSHWATDGGRAQLETSQSGMERSFKQRKSFGKLVFVRASVLYGILAEWRTVCSE